jgi:hypothetical protein
LSPVQRAAFEKALVDCRSATRAKRIIVEEVRGGDAEQFLTDGELMFEV